MNCIDCNTKLRKFKDGYICQKNHKYLSGSKEYDDILGSNKISIDVKSKKLNTKLCPECQTEVVCICMCSMSEKRCINNHVWTNKYYKGDKKYLCIDPPDNNKHVFNFES